MFVKTFDQKKISQDFFWLVTINNHFKYWFCGKIYRYFCLTVQLFVVCLFSYKCDFHTCLELPCLYSRKRSNPSYICRRAPCGRPGPTSAPAVLRAAEVPGCWQGLAFMDRLDRTVAKDLKTLPLLAALGYFADFTFSQIWYCCNPWEQEIIDKFICNLYYLSHWWSGT